MAADIHTKRQVNIYMKELFGSNTLTDCNGVIFRVDYFVTRDCGRIPGSTAEYGVSIEKGPESYHAKNCFESRENACVLLEKLAEYEVTPLSASETMDSLLDICEFRYQMSSRFSPTSPS